MCPLSRFAFRASFFVSFVGLPRRSFGISHFSDRRTLASARSTAVMISFSTWNSQDWWRAPGKILAIASG